MCQRLRVAIRVGSLDGQEFYQSADCTRFTFVAIKWRRKNGNAVEFALFGDVSQVNVVTLRNTVIASQFYIIGQKM